MGRRAQALGEGLYCVRPVTEKKSEMSDMDAIALSRWVTFAQSGGLGSCVAIKDYMASSANDLMFLEGDQITVLQELEHGKAFLGYCEGVVGHFNPEFVKFCPRSASQAASLAVPVPPVDHVDDGPLTPTSLTFTAASPPPNGSTLLSEGQHPQSSKAGISESGSSVAGALDAPSRSVKRVSSPFELDYGSEGTPSPGLDNRDGWFAAQQGDVSEPEKQALERDSLKSIGSASSIDWGGIGWMTSGKPGAEPAPTIELLTTLVSDAGRQGTSISITPLGVDCVTGSIDNAAPVPASFVPAPKITCEIHPATASSTTIIKPSSTNSAVDASALCSTETWRDDEEPVTGESEDDWDIYGDYAHQSMYFAPGSLLAAAAGMDGKRMSLAQRRASRSAEAASRPAIPPKSPRRSSETTPVADPALVPANTPSLPCSSGSGVTATDTPTISRGVSPLSPGDISVKSLASELRLRIQKDRSCVPVVIDNPPPVSPPAYKQGLESALEAAPPAISDSLESGIVEASSAGNAEDTIAPPPKPVATSIAEGQPRSAAECPPADKGVERQIPAINAQSATSTESDAKSSDAHCEGFNLTTASPLGMSRGLAVLPTSSPTEISSQGSPIPLALPDDMLRYPTSPHSHLSPALSSPYVLRSLSPQISALNRNPGLSPDPQRSGQSTTAAFRVSPQASPHQASPHSVEATQAAVTATRPMPDGPRIRGLTLVGRMDTDLTTAKGPMPISFLVDRPPANSPTVNTPSAPATLAAPRPTLAGLGLGLPESPGWGGEGPMPTSPRTPFELDAPGSPWAERPRTPIRNFTSPAPSSPVPVAIPLNAAGSLAQRRPRPRSRSFSNYPGPAIMERSNAKVHTPNPLQTPISPPTSQPMTRSASESSRKATMARKLSLSRHKAEAQLKQPPPLRIDPGHVNALISGESIPDSATLPADAPGQTKPAPVTPSTPVSIAGSKRSFWSSLSRKESASASRPAVASASSSLDPALPLSSPIEQDPTTSSQISKFNNSTTSLTTSDAQSSPLASPSSATRSSSFTLPKPTLILRKAKSQHLREKVHLTSLPSPVSHRDFEEETVKQDGMEFELMKPLARKQSTREGRPSTGTPLSPAQSPSSPHDAKWNANHLASTQPESPKLSQGRPLPDTDEWGFLKGSSPVPATLQTRSSAPGDHRAAEAKWLSIISVPIPTGASPPKKVRKMVLESGIPSSLRGRVWGWFMSGSLSARVPGLYEQLLAHDKGLPAPQIDTDVADCYKDHSVFVEAGGAGQQDLRALLRAYANFSPSGYRPEMALIAGGLLMHVPAEEAFWLLSGLISRVKDYYTSDARGLRLDAQVFTNILMGSDAKLAKFMLRDCGIKPIEFLGPWLLSLFVRILPWPTMLRVWDAVVCEGPRFLLQTSLAILTISRERLLALPKSSEAIISYLLHLPQDALLAPENVMKACDQVKLRDEDLVKLRAGAEKVLREEAA